MQIPRFSIESKKGNCHLVISVSFQTESHEGGRSARERERGRGSESGGGWERGKWEGERGRGGEGRGRRERKEREGRVRERSKDTEGLIYKSRHQCPATTEAEAREPGSKNDVSPKIYFQISKIKQINKTEDKETQGGEQEGVAERGEQEGLEERGR